MAGASDLNIADTHVAVCPQCSAQLAHGRSSAPDIDACGFESYHFNCETCGASLVGIVDPADDALLISQIPA